MGCKTKYEMTDQQIEDAFKNFLISQNIQIGQSISEKELPDSIYNKYYSDYLRHKTKTALEANPYLKVNKVYVNYRNPTFLEFVVYADDETICVSTMDLEMDNRILSEPQNGRVKVLRPIYLQYFATFEIKDNIIKTRKHQRSPYKEWYAYVNGYIEKDTIQFNEAYKGSGKSYEYKKSFWSKRVKKDFTKEVYQSGLKAERLVDDHDLVYFLVTGELEYPKEMEEKRKINPFELPFKTNKL